MSYLIRDCGHQFRNSEIGLTTEHGTPDSPNIIIFQFITSIASDIWSALLELASTCAGTELPAIVPRPGCSVCSFQQLPWISSIRKPASRQHKGCQKIRPHYTGQGDHPAALIWDICAYAELASDPVVDLQSAK